MARVVILSEDEEEDFSGDLEAAERRKIAIEEARQARWRMELTPPPDLSAEREKELSRIIAWVPLRNVQVSLILTSGREHIVIEVSDGEDADGFVGSGPGSPAQEVNVPASDQAVNLNISMRVDPARKEAGMSDIAIRNWEKQRRIIIGRVCTRALTELAVADDCRSGIPSCARSRAWRRSSVAARRRL